MMKQIHSARLRRVRHVCNQRKEEKYNFVIPEGSMPLSKKLMRATAKMPAA